MTVKRILRVGVAAIGTITILSVAAGIAILRSGWFREQIRSRIVTAVETATGGRADLGSFSIDWRTLRAEIRSFAIHGNEPAGKAPLFRASSVAVGLKIVSILKRDIDIQSLDVADPRVYLLVHPDGRTNVPEPKIKGKGNAAETILNLAIGRFSLRNGFFEVESRGATPFDARGENLNARFTYERAGPRYRGEISIQPLDLQVEDSAVTPFGVNLTLAMERNRVAIHAAKITTGGSAVELDGVLDDLSSPRATFQYDARVSLGDIARMFHVPELRRGDVQVGGSGAWSGAAGLTATGNVRARGVEFRDSTILLRNGRLEGAATIGPHGIDVTGARLATTYYSSRGQAPAEGRIASIALRNKLLELRGITLSVLDGTFHGEARLRDWQWYTVAGDIAGFDARRVVALYSPEPLPWDGQGGGPIRVEGSLRRKSALTVAADLAVTPAAEGSPVHGEIHARFEAASEILDLGRSTLTLPSSRAEFAGAFGRQLRAHLETTDLNDLLPLLGANARSLPVKLQGGRATFDGTVTGKLAHPEFDGRLTAKSFLLQDRLVDSLEGEVLASPENVRLRNAILARGALRAHFDAQLALNDWEAGDGSQIFGNGTIDNALVPDLLALAGIKDVPATGVLNGSAQLTGTVGNPLIKGAVTIVKGTFRDEPFDQFSASLAYSGDTAEMASGHLAAGPKQIDLTASYRHSPGTFEAGRLHFQVRSNVMPLAGIATLQEARPGAKGDVAVTASGDLDIGPKVRVAALHADISAHSLQLEGQQFGDAHLTADTQGQAVRTQLDANFANSRIHGDGTWRLEGDYPGSATVTFSRVDFGQLRAWIAPSDSETGDRFTGFAEGEMRIEGPALNLEAMKAEVRLPKLEIGPTPAAGVPSSISLHNEGPIVATVANSVLTVQSARLTGRATDIGVTGRILLKDKNPLDLRVSGRIDLGIAHDFNPDFVSSGTLLADAAVRGSTGAPQITGRMQVQNAALSIVDFPNGISNANGVVLFSGSRATIEKLSGETGGGKVDISGFVSYPEDELIFQLNGSATQVRVRYPEGVSTVANADLRLTGTSVRSTLAGTITILRTGFNPQSDFSSIIATSAEPVRTPAARTGLLGGLNFDVQIETAPDIQFQSSLTQDLQVEANLRLRGNASNPAFLGRINITQGQVVFYGTRYTINQGSVAFYNPLKIDPILDIDLETKARGIDVTLTISGPLNKLNLTPRSDPPLQFNEIVALLATGRAPTSDPSLLAQQATAPQSWQQMGASALLGQAIANPVAGRLQRFFGVSKLRIDPTLPGVENNPQARLTLEQQVTPDVTFTYITNVTSSNPQVVRVEWSVSKQWSVVVLREENGVYSLDFFYKKRF